MFDAFINVVQDWLSRSGDTSFWSVIITVLYVIVIPASIMVTLRIKKETDRFALWSAVSLFLLVMGINKQLDLQTLIILLGKGITGGLGLHDVGRELARMLALSIFSLALIGCGAVLVKARRCLKEEKAALTGTGILLLFMIIRVGAITHVRRLMILQYIVYRVHALELLGLIIFLLAVKGNLKKIGRNTASDREQESLHPSL